MGGLESTPLRFNCLDDLLPGVETVWEKEKKGIILIDSTITQASFGLGIVHYLVQSQPITSITVVKSLRNTMRSFLVNFRLLK